MKTGIPEFRAMKMDDLGDVLSIENSVYDFPWSEGIMTDCIRVGYYCRVMTIDNAVTAFSVMSVGAGEAHLLNICVHPDWHGQGLGRTMLEYMLDKARKQQVGTIFLEVRISNQKAINLYHSVGFNQIGCRRNYYPAHDGREHAVILALDFIC